MPWANDEEGGQEEIRGPGCPLPAPGPDLRAELARPLSMQARVGRQQRPCGSLGRGRPSRGRGGSWCPGTDTAETRHVVRWHLAVSRGAGAELDPAATCPAETPALTGSLPGAISQVSGPLRSPAGWADREAAPGRARWASPPPSLSSLHPTPTAASCSPAARGSHPPSGRALVRTRKGQGRG